MMARVAKFKRTILVPVLRDLYRDLEEYRSTVVDKSQTHLNYTYGCQTWNEAKSKALERELEIMNGKIIKQSRPLFSWLVKYPTGNVSVSERDFFEAVRDYMVQTYGEANVIAVCVHMDETRPHCHCLIIPEVESRHSGKRTVSTASLLDRNHLLWFHKDCNNYMFKRFGERNLITLPKEDRVGENVSMLELKKQTLQTEIEELEESIKQLLIQKQELETELGISTKQSKI